MWPNLQLPENLVTFTDEILKGKLFLCSGDIGEVLKEKHKVKVLSIIVLRGTSTPH